MDSDEEKLQVAGFTATALSRVHLITHVFGQKPLLEVVHNFKEISDSLVNKSNEALVAARELPESLTKDERWESVSEEHRVNIKKLIIETVCMLGTLEVMNFFGSVMEMIKKMKGEEKE